MDIPTLLNNLREEVSCPVCKDIFTDPRHLSCQHSFCLECLQNWHRASGGGNAIRCPKCQTLSRLPASGDVNDIPTSFYLNGLIDVLAIKECNTTQVTCRNCDKRSSAASYCFQCCIFYCEQCLIGHDVMKRNKVHRVLAMKEFQEKDYEDVLKRPAFCSKPRHEKEELKFFCENCEMAVCQTCINMQHSGHALEHIEVEAERQRTEMRKTVETQRQNLQAKKNTIKQLNDGKTKLKQKGEDVKRHVQTFIDGLIAVLVKKEINIFQAVDNQTKHSVEYLSAETVKIENEIKEIETSLEKAEKLLTRTTDIDVVAMKPSLQKFFEESVQNKTDSRVPGSLPTFTFVKNGNVMEAIEREELGSLNISHHTNASQSLAEGKGLKEALAGVESKFNLITRDYEKAMRYNKNDLVTVEILDERKRDCKMGVRVQDNKTGRYEISYCPRDQGKYSISIKVNGKHVCGSPYDLLVKAYEQASSSGNLSSQGRGNNKHSPSPSASRYFSLEQGAHSQGMPLKQFQLKPVSAFGGFGSFVGMFNCPWGVAVSDTDEIAVTDQWNHRVQIFDSNGNCFRSFGCKGTNQGEFDYPCGICFDDNGNVFVAENGNHRIQIFTREGTYKGMFGGQGSLDSQLCHPWGLSLDASGDIIVADSGNKLIKIFTTDGNLVRTIGEPDSLSCPVHCVQCDEYFIVSDQDDHCIKVFSSEGEFQYKFGQWGKGIGQFKYPQCLSMTKSKHLMVCDMSNHRIKVFELNGRFVGKFGTKGTKGNKFGELYHPMSVAFLSDDRIVVSDWGNNRIQIFE